LQPAATLGKPADGTAVYLNPWTYTAAIEDPTSPWYLYRDQDLGVAAARLYNGTGKIGFLAWGYQNAGALGLTVSDGNWNQLLAVMAQDVHGVSSVPEPQSVALLAVGGLALLGYARRPRHNGTGAR